MNISIYTTTDFPYGGAAENLVRNIACGFIKNDCNVFIKLIRGHSYDQNLLVKKFKENIFVDFLVFKNRPNNEFIKIIELLLSFIGYPINILKDKFKYKIDYILLYGVEYVYQVFIILIFSKLLRIKIIRFITDYYDKDLIVPVFWKSPKYMFHNLQINFLDKYLDGLIYLSIFFKELAIKNNFNLRKILFLPHLIDASHFLPIKVFNGFKDKIFIGFIGTISEINGIYVLLDAFTELSNKYENIYLTLIGEVRVKNQSLFNQYLEHTRIKYCGQINFREIVEHIERLDILVNPRLPGIFAEAGFPTKVAEYLLSGRPTISSSTENLEYYLEDNKQIIFTIPGSVEDLTIKLEKLINNENFCKQLALEGRNWAKENVCNINNIKKMKLFFATL